MQQRPETGPVQKAQTAFSLLVFIARAFATPLEVCLRRGFGPRYFGFQALAALLAVALWATVWPPEQRGPVVWFWWWLVLMFALARRDSLRAAARGEHVHTRYNGWPRLASVFKRMPEARIKAAAEPGLSLAAGIGLLYVSEPLGALVIVSAISLALVQGTIEAAEHARAAELNDALIEQQQLAERFRGMQRSRFR